MKVGVDIFNLNGKASIWREHIRKVKKINEIKNFLEAIQEVLSTKIYL